MTYIKPKPKMETDGTSCVGVLKLPVCPSCAELEAEVAELQRENERLSGLVYERDPDNLRADAAEAMLKAIAALMDEVESVLWQYSAGYVISGVRAILDGEGGRR